MKQQAFAPWAEPVPDAPYPLSALDVLAQRDDGWRYELVEGRLARMTPTGLEHSDVVGSFYRALYAFVSSRQLGTVTLPETGYVISQPGTSDTLLAPDLAFVAAGRLPPRGARERKRFLAVAPDLVVEVVSPHQFHPEMGEKARLWLDAGVRLLWMVWPDAQEIDVWRPFQPNTAIQTLQQTDTLDGLDVLPGFTHPVSDVFV